jgi:hypothetical protein
MCVFVVTKLQKPGGKEIKILSGLSMKKHVCLHGDKATKARRERDKCPIRPKYGKACVPSW